MKVVAFVAGGAEGVLEMFAAPFGPIKARIAGVAKMFEAAFLEMFGGEMADGDVVGFEPWKGWDEASGADVDDWDWNVFEGGGDIWIFDAGDDAVAVPVGEPGGRLIAAVVFGEVKGPGTMFADVGDDAAEETARVGVGGLDQKGDFDRGFQLVRP